MVAVTSNVNILAGASAIPNERSAAKTMASEESNTGPRIAGAPQILMAPYVAEYCRLTDRTGLPSLNWYFAYNSFRMAAIVQGVLGRVRDGTANSPQAAAAGADRVPKYANSGWAFAKEAGAA